MTEQDVEARLRRLEQLTRGLSREISLWREGKDPLLYLERRGYLNAMQDLLAAAESARIVLSKALTRMRPPASGE
jgi:hypothetical protein